MKNIALGILILCLAASQAIAAQTETNIRDDLAFTRQAERPVDLTKEKTLYSVGYAHLDTQWRWTYPLVIREFIYNTMSQNFPLIEKYPNYIFNFTGSRRYEFMKEYYPESYEQVKKYVAAGRWFPAGSSVDEGDAIVPSLESLVRHFLYGNRFFQKEFGIQSDEFMLPDCFGFPASLPTILAHGGIKGFSTQKLTWGYPDKIPFSVGVWKGPDGSGMLSAINALDYGSLVTEDLSKSPMWLKRIEATGEKSGIFVDFHYYGTGDRGGAPKESSVEWIERSMAGSGPVRVISSKADQMFKSISPEQAAKLPTHQGEFLLTKHSAGSMTSQAYMKRWNRKNEMLAHAAESAATAAAWLGAFPYPRDALYAAWNLVLGSQMHDILPGTSLPKAYEYSWNDEVLALNQFAAITERATSAVLSQLDTRAEGVSVAVYNPLSISREDPVEALISFPGNPPEAVTAYDTSGKPVPTQILGKEGIALRILFLASAPSVGYAIYDVRQGANPDLKSELAMTQNSLENNRYKVTVNPSGDISSIFDKVLDRELLASPIRLSFHTENPTEFPAWNMDWADRKKPARRFVEGPAKIRVVESGPVRVALEIERTAENSTFTQQVRLNAGSAGNRVELLDRIDWRSYEASLKANFSFTAGNPEAAYDDNVGVVRRNNNTEKRYEVPQHLWMDLTDAGGGHGVAILNDSKFGSDKPDDHTLRLTLLFTPGVRKEFQDQSTQDHGRHEILYAMAAHRGDWREGDIPWQAARLNQPLRAFLPQQHEGPMAKSFSLVSLNRNDQVQIVAIKQAEDSEEIIVRVKELSGRPATGLRMRFVAPVVAAREVDGQERPIGNASINEGALAFEMKGFGVRAFAIKLEPPQHPAERIVSQPISLDFDVDVASANTNREDGAMDAEGRTFPAEMLPATLVREGIEFRLGPTGPGEKNALEARGQRIDLPDGFNHVHILAAAAGDISDRIKVGAESAPFIVPGWTGFIGQWDNRLWNSPIPELSYSVNEKVVGLAPGFIKRTPVAWFSTHHHHPSGDAFYEFSYLFQLSYALPPGAKSVTLPDDPKVRIFAMSVGREPSMAPPAAPLYDTLAEHHYDGAPSIPQAGQALSEATKITLLPGLYHQPGELRYTLDGTDPTEDSPLYNEPFFAVDRVNIAVRQFGKNGYVSPVTRGVVDIQDHTPPRIVSALTKGPKSQTLEITFSKPIAAPTATDMKNFAITPPATLSKIVQSPDGCSVDLVFDTPLAPCVNYSLIPSGLKDTTPFGNSPIQTAVPFNSENIVYRLPSAGLPEGSVSVPVSDLPLHADEAWTMNLLVHPAFAPEDRTLIAGFGHDNQAGPGLGRYLAVFKDGIRFWAERCDVATNSPLAVGQWQMLTATYDGNELVLYKDGQQIGKKQVPLATDTRAKVNVGTSDPWGLKNRFNGTVQEFTIRRGALAPAEVKELFASTKPKE